MEYAHIISDIHKKDQDLLVKHIQVSSNTNSDDHIEVENSTFDIGSTFLSGDIFLSNFNRLYAEKCEFRNELVVYFIRAMVARQTKVGKPLHDTKV